MSRKIFISYRRADSADFTVALYNALCEHFEAHCIFKDINNIPPGMEFSQVLSKALDESAVVLAIIGPEWISTGGQRLQDPNDWVRMELEHSLKRQLRVVPILVNGADLPAETELPLELAPLRKRQVHRIDNTRFAYDVRLLAEGISDVIPLRRKRKRDAGSSFDTVFKSILLCLMVGSMGLIGYAWILSDDTFSDKLVMSGLGGIGLMGGWAAFSRQRWIELRANQIE